MKKLYFILISLWLFLFWFFSYGNYDWNSATEQIYTKDQSNVVSSNDINDPLRNWTTAAVNWEWGSVWWIAYADVSNSDAAQKNTVAYIAKWINYFLWFLWFLAIIMIIKDGIVIIVSAWDENKKKEALKNVRNYILAIIWIWAAYLLVNLIFYFININTWVIS